jgi:hypothetical protein
MRVDLQDALEYPLGAAASAAAAELVEQDNSPIPWPRCVK